MKKFAAAAAVLGGLFPVLASAHEAYVLDPEYFKNVMNGPVSLHAFAALRDPGNIMTFLEITLGIVLAFGLHFLFRRSPVGRRFYANWEKLSAWGSLVVRLAISASFFFSALSGSFLGPEVPLSVLPWAPMLRVALFGASFMFLFGFLTELAAGVSLVIFCLAYAKFGLYLATYLNYLGEILVLLLFGSRRFSLDKLILGARRRWAKFAEYETTIVRVFYGLALSYAALTVKFLHPQLTLQVVEQYHLTKFWYLFPHDPLLVALGAALAELAIGIFIILGLELRLTVLISLIYITLSLLYFREAVWPHLMLYGISVNLLVARQKHSLDSWLDKKFS